MPINKRNNSLVSLLFMTFFAVFLSHSLYAEEQIMTIESTITGSQEQPNILVIVPWHKPDAAIAIESAEDEELANNVFLQPLERKTFLHKTHLLQQLITNDNSH